MENSIQTEKKSEFKTNINRSNWDKHPKFHFSMASFLLRVHNSFRKEMKKISDLCKENDLEEAKYLFENLKEGLDFHHHIEEIKLFPYLGEKLNLKMESGKLYNDHKIMNDLLEQLVETFNASKLEKFEKYQKELAELTKKFEEHMLQHLIDEEDISIPAILETDFN
eukprot:TRINITY_DN9615_c0_g1_i1.p1 TRINITY_DN9615_c0_g1~~TRINITY_DN9615_c0_g1_i1.p1  ORF type:complete len:167 (+),score=54.44 TRINITY_DN9615_c0_g1_i1:134-634(+)